MKRGLRWEFGNDAYGARSIDDDVIISARGNWAGHMYIYIAPRAAVSMLFFLFGTHRFSMNSSGFHVKNPEKNRRVVV